MARLTAEGRIMMTVEGGIMARQHESLYRELVGLFHEAEDLEQAISKLTSSGWDHAELSLLAQGGLLSPDHVVEDTHDIAENSGVERQSPVSETDVRQGRTLMTGMAGVAAAFLASGATIMTGGGALAAIVGAAAAGGGAAAVTEALGWRVGSGRAAFLQEQIEQGGILLWVKIRAPEEEQLAANILADCGGTEIHVHEMDADET
ncbi:MAG: hypothetical protein WD767_05325 [Alphaproteobacteria bacterium]